MNSVTTAAATTADIHFTLGLTCFTTIRLRSNQINLLLQLARTSCAPSTGWPKRLASFFLYALTLPNINRFSKLFHCQNQDKICNNTVAKDPTTPQVCRYTTLWNVSVIKATIEIKTTYVTTNFKKTWKMSMHFAIFAANRWVNRKVGRLERPA